MFKTGNGDSCFAHAVEVGNPRCQQVVQGGLGVGGRDDGVKQPGAYARPWLLLLWEWMDGYRILARGPKDIQRQTNKL